MEGKEYHWRRYVLLYLCSEPFIRTAHRVDGPGPFTRQNIECMAHLLDELLRFGPERLFSEPHIVSPPTPPIKNYVGAIPTAWASIQISPRYVTTSKYPNNGILDDHYANCSNWDSAYWWKHFRWALRATKKGCFATNKIFFYKYRQQTSHISNSGFLFWDNVEQGK